MSSSPSKRAFVAAALVAQSISPAANATEPQNTRSNLSAQASAETSVYTDNAHVDVFTPTIAGTIENELAGYSISGRYLVDVVTAASADIVATASPPWREARHAGSLEATYKPGNLDAGAHLSGSFEPDYRSLSAGLCTTLDLFQKNITLLGSYTYRNDTAGRSGTPFDVFEYTLHRHDLSAGLTVVVNRATILSATLDAMLERGNQAKPYRYIPLFNESDLDRIPAGASVTQVNALRLHPRPLEALPTSRNRFALTARLAHRTKRATLRLEERLYLDSWGLPASTTDARYMLDINRFLTVWPRARLHAQGGADFWQRAYTARNDDSEPISIPLVRTGDRELSPLWTLTTGAGLSVKLNDHFSATLEIDGVFTHYLDALYIEHRAALFTALSVQASFD